MPRIAQTAWRLAKEPDPPGAKVELPDLPTAEDQLLPQAGRRTLPAPRALQVANTSSPAARQDINGLARNPAYPFLACQLFGCLDPAFGER